MPLPHLSAELRRKEQAASIRSLSLSPTLRVQNIIQSKSAKILYNVCLLGLFHCIKSGQKKANAAFECESTSERDSAASKLTYFQLGTSPLFSDRNDVLFQYPLL